MRRKARSTGTDLLPFRENEMAQLVSFLFSKRFFEGKGDPGRGQKVLAAKHCGACHDLKAKEGPFSAQRMASALWQHGPTMLAEMDKKTIRWPAFTGREMADLVAYLNR